MNDFPIFGITNQFNEPVTVTPLSTGWFVIAGKGPMDFSQVPTWPCSEDEIRKGAMYGASENFIRSAARCANGWDCVT